MIVKSFQSDMNLNIILEMIAKSLIYSLILQVLIHI